MASRLLVATLIACAVTGTAGTARAAESTEPLPRERTAPFGATSASAGVTDAGQARYAVAFDAPPGLAGLEPEVGISATAASAATAQSLVGVGWRLTGFSSIERCPMSMGRAGDWARPFGDPLGARDSYCLDGKLLVPVNGENGIDGTEYHTDTESFARIVQRGGDGDGPEGFDVYTKAGRILRYGGAQDAVERNGIQRRSWLIHQEADRSGNTMTYEYGRARKAITESGLPIVSSVLAPTQIRYGAHDGGGVAQYDDRSIRFTYDETLAGIQFQWSRGRSNLDWRRLSTVETYVRGRLIKRYRLRYDARHGVRRLADVRECAPPGGADPSEACKGTTAFTYDDGEGFGQRRTGVGLDLPKLFGNGPAAGDIGQTMVLDVNGDGRDDLFYPTPTDTISCRSDLRCAGTSWQQQTLALATGNEDAPFTVIQLPDSRAELRCAGVVSVADFDGDGREDLLCGNSVRLSTGTGFKLQTGNEPYRYPSHTGNVLEVSSADLDGDGRPDLVACRQEGSKPPTLEVRRNLGSGRGFSPDPIEVPNYGHDGDSPLKNRHGGGGPEPCEAPLLIDTDGDGVVNVMKRKWTVKAQPDNQTTVWTQTWKSLSLNASKAQWDDTGLSFDTRIDDRDLQDDAPWTRPAFWLQGGDLGKAEPAAVWARKWQMRVLDVNGDGLDDIIRYDDAEADPIRLDINTGAGFQSGNFGGFLTSSPRWAGVRMTAYEFARMQVVDANDDGRDDLLFPVEDPREDGGPPYWNIAYAREGAPFLLEPAGRMQLAPHGMPIQADIDGDGSSDLILPTAQDGLIDGFDNKQTRMSIQYGDHAKANALTSATDGVGKVVRWAYETEDGGLRTHASTGACAQEHAACVHRPGPLVSSMSLLATEAENDESEATRRIRRTSYHWFNAREALYGRGSLGFGTRIVASYGATDAALRSTTVTTLDPGTYAEDAPGGRVHHSYPRRGRVVAESTTSAPVLHGVAQVTQRTDRTVEYREQASPAGLPFSSASKDTAVTALGPPTGADTRRLSTVTQTTTLDDDGNATASRNETRNGSGGVIEATEVTTEFDRSDARRSRWLLGLPLRRTTVSTRQGAEQTQALRFVHSTYRALVETVERDPDGQVANARQARSSEYDAYGNVTSTTLSADGQEPRRTTIAYDTRGQTPITVTNALGHETTVVYDHDFNLPLVEVDPNGVVTKQAYDGFGRLVRTRGPNGGTRTERYGFDGAGGATARTRTVVSTDGAPTVRTWADALGRTVKASRTGYEGKEVVSEVTYDDRDRAVSATRPHGAGDDSQGTVRSSYDALGRPLTVQRPDEDAAGGTARTTYSYGDPEDVPGHDGWSEKVKQAAVTATGVSDPLGRRRWRVADPVGRTVATVAAGGSTVQLEYGPFGALTGTDDGASHATYTVDPYGRTTQLASPEVQRQTMTWTPFDQLADSTVRVYPLDSDPVEFGHHMTYDRLGRPVAMTSIDEQPRHWDYDGPGPNAIGKLTKATITGPGGYSVTTQHDYEPVPGGGDANRGLLRRTTETVNRSRNPGKAPHVFTTRYGYDAQGHTTQIDQPSAAGPLGVEQRFDAHGFLTRVGNAAGGLAYWTFLGSDQGLRVQDEQLGNGLRTHTDFRAGSGRVDATRTTRPDGSLVQQLAYAYSPTGAIRSVRDGVVPGRSRAYDYDVDGRLTAARGLDGNDPARPGAALESFTYDAFGRMASQAALGAYGYVGRFTEQTGRAVQTAGAYGYSLDENGGQIERTVAPGGTGHERFISANWGRLQLPSRVFNRFDQPGQDYSDHLYDATDRVVARTNRTVDRTEFSTRLARETVWPDPGHDISHRAYIRAQGRTVAQVLRTEHPADGSVSERTEYPLMDRLGSPSVRTDASGATTGTDTYGAYGRTASVEQEPTGELGYTGQEAEDPYGLMMMGARVYDPELAHFTHVDPALTDYLGSPVGPQNTVLARVAQSLAPGDGTAPVKAATDLLDPYAYAANDPVNYVDPTGESPLSLNSANYTDADRPGAERLDAFAWQLGVGAVAQVPDWAEYLVSGSVNTLPATGATDLGGAAMGMVEGLVEAIASPAFGPAAPGVAFLGVTTFAYNGYKFATALATVIGEFDKAAAAAKADRAVGYSCQYVVCLPMPEPILSSEPDGGAATTGGTTPVEGATTAVADPAGERSLIGGPAQPTLDATYRAGRALWTPPAQPPSGGGGGGSSSTAAPPNPNGRPAGQGGSGPGRDWSGFPDGPDGPDAGGGGPKDGDGFCFCFSWPF